MRSTALFAVVTLFNFACGCCRFPREGVVTFFSAIVVLLLGVVTFSVAVVKTARAVVAMSVAFGYRKRAAGESPISESP